MTRPGDIAWNALIVLGWAIAAAVLTLVLERRRPFYRRPVVRVINWGLIVSVALGVVIALAVAAVMALASD
jgi:hypothetical protein